VPFPAAQAFLMQLNQKPLNLSTTTFIQINWISKPHGTPRKIQRQSPDCRFQFAMMIYSHMGTIVTFNNELINAENLKSHQRQMMTKLFWAGATLLPARVQISRSFGC
jgi:hypothetical protein